MCSSYTHFSVPFHSKTPNNYVIRFTRKTICPERSYGYLTDFQNLLQSVLQAHHINFFFQVRLIPPLPNLEIISQCSSFFFLSFVFFGLHPWKEDGGSQAKGLIGAVASGLLHSHSNASSELHLQTTPQPQQCQLSNARSLTH